MVHLITGGARSGKSSYAEKIALQNDQSPTYIATARKWDEDFQNRIYHHQLNRGPEWINLEIEKKFAEADLKSQWIVIDCITLWLTNLFYDNKQGVENSLHEARQEINKIVARKELNWLIITNELGMGLHAESAIGRKFVDLQGWVNQYLAAKANQVTLMVSGIHLQIK